MASAGQAMRGARCCAVQRRGGAAAAHRVVHVSPAVDEESEHPRRRPAHHGERERRAALGGVGRGRGRALAAPTQAPHLASFPYLLAAGPPQPARSRGAGGGQPTIAHREVSAGDPLLPIPERKPAIVAPPPPPPGVPFQPRRHLHHRVDVRASRQKSLHALGAPGARGRVEERAHVLALLRSTEHASPSRFPRQGRSSMLQAAAHSVVPTVEGFMCTLLPARAS